MIKLFKKELRLNVHPLLFLFCLFGLMILIPNYPYIVGIGYMAMPIFIYFQSVNENRSQEFSAILPVKRSDIVAASTLIILLFQIITVIIAAICAYPSILINPNKTNYVGLDCNFTFYGVALICLGAFNLLLIPRYFRTGKGGISMLLSLIVFAVTYLAIELVVQFVPTLTAALDGFNPDYIWARLTILGVGIIIYTVATFLAYKKAVKIFETVNL